MHSTNPGERINAVTPSCCQLRLFEPRFYPGEPDSFRNQAREFDGRPAFPPALPLVLQRERFSV